MELDDKQKALAGIAIMLITAAGGYGTLEASTLDPYNYLIFNHSEVDITHACSYYDFANPSSLWELNESSMNATDRLHTGRIVALAGTLKSSGWEVLTIEKYSDMEWIPDVQCKDKKTDNGTEQECTDKGHSVTTEKTRAVWKSATDKIVLKPKESVQVRFCGDYQPVKKTNGWGIEIDHIPSIRGQELSRYAWWNASWAYRVQINLSTVSNLTEYQLNMTVNINGSKTNGSDIRFTYLNGSTEQATSHWLQTGNFTYGNSTLNTSGTIWVLVPFISDANSSIIYMYYGNAAATDTSDISLVAHKGAADDFTNTTLNTSKFIVAGAGSYSINGTDLAIGSPASGTKYTTVKFNSSTYIWSDFNDTVAIIKLDTCTGIQCRFSIFNTSQSGDGNPGQMSDRLDKTATPDSRATYTYPGGAGSANFNPVSLDLTAPELWFMHMNLYSATNLSAVSYLNILGNGTTSVSTNSLNQTGFTYGGFGIMTQSNGGQTNMSIDWIFTRKFAATEPTYALGAEETQSVTLAITLLFPANGSITNLTAINYTWLASGWSGQNLNCTLFRNGSSVGSVTCASDVDCNLTTSPPSGTWNWYVNCTNTTHSAISGIFTYTRTLFTDTNLNIWNGSAWNAFTNQMTFRCSNPFPTHCAPQNQNNASGQPIILNINNGTGNSTWQAIKTNTTWATANLSCGTSTDPNAATVLTTNYKNYSTSALLVGENNTLYCWLYIASVPADFPRSFNITIENG